MRLATEKPALLVTTVPVHAHAVTPVIALQAVFPKERFRQVIINEVNDYRKNKITSRNFMPFSVGI